MTHLVKCGSHRSRRSGDISFFISHVTSCDHVITGWSLPSVVTIRLVKVEIWSILISNVRTGIHMIILLQSVTIQFRRLFWHILYYKVWQSNFITKYDRLLLQSASGITKCDRLLLQSASGIIKCDRLSYKVRQVLQGVTVTTKWDVTSFLKSSWNLLRATLKKLPRVFVWYPFLPSIDIKLLIKSIRFFSNSKS